MSAAPVARQRRHTLYFLDEIRGHKPVFLDTEVDMTRIEEHRTAGRRTSVLSYVLYAASRVLASHPEANAAIHGRLLPRIARYSSVSGKIALDKRVGGRRVVLAAVLPRLEETALSEIQRQVEYYRDGDPATLPEFAGVHTLHRLPWPVARLAYTRTVRPLSRRAGKFGTLAVSSLGHRPVDGFHSVGGTTLTLGLGRVTDRPVVRRDAVTIAPVMRLNLAFDHRVIDGAEAADILGEIKAALEDFQEDAPPGPAASAVVAGKGGGR
ncbi:2-oxo acid dehydrogenase subunit E2 [Streptomyces sp. NPDC001274]